MTILVTAASGHLGRLVVDALLARGADPASLVAGARTPSKVADLAERGVRTVELDYSEPETLAAALVGVDSVLLVSASEPGNRAALHQNVIDAAVAAGVTKLVYTSAPLATTADFVLAPEHKATEEAIVASGLPAVILRNNWYIENYADDFARAADSGQLVAAVGDGRIAPATRADFADAAAVVLLDDGHLGQVYELGGDEAIGYDALAAAMGEALGREVVYVPITAEQQRAGLEAAGLDAGTVGFVAAISAGIGAGAIDIADGTLARLIGRPTTTPADGFRALLVTA